MLNLAAKAAVILVVDDDALININAVDMLERLGHTALEAYSAIDALIILASDHVIDLLIIDYSMPGMNGVETDLPRLPKPYQQSGMAGYPAVLLNGQTSPVR
ncbi:MAG: response regulator [Candidatus Devosia euplotis]|nr:response regulator [Candidatus Devosia euplotis]